MFSSWPLQLCISYYRAGRATITYFQPFADWREMNHFVWTQSANEHRHTPKQHPLSFPSSPLVKFNVKLGSKLQCSNTHYVALSLISWLPDRALLRKLNGTDRIAVNEKVNENSSPVSVPSQQETVLIVYIFNKSVSFLIDTTSLSCVLSNPRKLRIFSVKYYLT